MTAGTFISYTDFVAQTGISITQTVVEEALEYAKREILNKFFKKKIYVTKNSDTVHYLISDNLSVPYLPFYLADGDGSGSVTTDDISVYTLNTSTYVETSKTANISSLNVKYGVLTLDTSLPTGDDELRVEYYVAKYPDDKILYVLRKISKLFAAVWLFENVPFEKLQKGISNWTLNGVSVTFDRQAMSEAIKESKQELLKMYREYALLNITSSPLQQS